jgi:uncharacterized protein YndB with AHSA1/START domain
MSEASLIVTSNRKPVLRFERFLPRPLDEVWQAITDPTEMLAWFPTRIEIDEWEPGATLLHHFEDQSLEPLTGTVIEYDRPHRLAFTWGEDTIRFELTADDGGTRFVLTDELAAAQAARNAAGWDVCLDRLVEGAVKHDWTSRFRHYRAEYEPLLGAQEGPPDDAHN